MTSVLEHLRILVGFDTTNDGSGRPGPDSERIIEYIDQVMGGGEIVRTGPQRSHANLVTRIEGHSSNKPRLIHAHVDVVPVDRDEWQTDPFALEEVEGLLHGRGVVDMKHHIAYTLAAVERWREQKLKPAHDLIFAFFSDEECGGFNGAHQVVSERPDLFADVEFSLGEGGGYADEEIMLISVGERGVGAVTLTARGEAGHASTAPTPTALGRLVRALPALEDTQESDRILEVLEHVPAELRIDGDRDLVVLIIEGYLSRVTTTVLNAGNLPNISPGKATARLDVRMAPGRDEAVLARLKSAAYEAAIESEILSMRSVGDPAAMDIPAAIVQVLEDRGYRPVPYFFPASTDAKHLSSLVPRNYGFTPTPRWNAHVHMHSSQERIPLSSLLDGADIFDQVLLTI